MIDKKAPVGVIGLGTMGGAVARNLVERGWTVFGYDVSPQRVAEAQAAGVRLVDSPAAIAAAATTILTSLPSPRALHDVVQELAEHATRGCIVAELSTLALEDKTNAESVLRGAGHRMLDCPLSGTGAQAANRDLVIYASGGSEDIEALNELFLDFGRAAHNVGPFGNGTKMKFVANLLVAINNVASAEAMVLGMKAGLPAHQIIELISAGAGNSRIFELRAPLMADQRYEPATMSIGLWQKDMRVIDEFARQLGCPTPLFTATESVYRAALANGQNTQDTASVCTVLENMAGLHRP
ncbi:NAD(P)-dependent oxidoreductase [Microvirga subterranea]|uniref:3-hydroxyisobutyrate dehydrogenase/2-hydroxy-3-oxopropionate reductase n=1 Tax=Microvirga subterranea TaxID=186651 RepID=A0A370HGR4_9HYPH|nr:NAD(P)-dependent oxidoreductase [Microvirga subterranea]RDI56816.1 3-hydroxyisobutyrate dehydrogenase/2-hydroxy-3-oxopropionate reductase [Microvirga subterranea]